MVFKKLFGKGNKSKAPKGFHSLEIEEVKRLTKDTVQVILDIPNELKSTFTFIPGQYLTFAIDINGTQERRSYSICSGANEPLAVAVKEVAGGKVSTWFNQAAAAGMEVFVSEPEGSFIRKSQATNIVAIAAGSGITPILSIAKDINSISGNMHLLYGNRTNDTIIFKNTLDSLEHVHPHYFLSGESMEGYRSGRISKESLTEFIKSDLSVLKSDGFFLCGPEQLIVDAVEVLETFGVAKDKIHFELFTTPVLMKSAPTPTSSFSGTSKVSVFLDDEEINFELASDGKVILDMVNSEGYDAPYSCKGGVCSSCKAKIIEGNVTMKLNYSLTDSEIEEGYILTCQAQPASETLKITYDV